MAKHPAHRRRKALATSFVITIGAAAASTTNEGCKKKGVGESEGGGTTFQRERDGSCFLSYYAGCPKEGTCNPPPPMRVDCPPELRDASDSTVVRRRPPGKEKWLRVPPELWFVDKECKYRPEYFCPMPPAGDACTASEIVKVACTEADGGTRTVASFVYKDGVGTCRRIPAASCTPDRRGECVLPEGDEAPCP
jgi:hypothetical protein